MEKYKLLLFCFIAIIATVLTLSAVPNFFSVSGGITNSEIFAAMGMFGAALAVVGLVYGAETAKSGEIIDALKYTFIIEVAAMALIVAWLYSI